MPVKRNYFIYSLLTHWGKNYLAQILMPSFDNRDIVFLNRDLGDSQVKRRDYHSQVFLPDGLHLNIDPIFEWFSKPSE